MNLISFDLAWLSNTEFRLAEMERAAERMVAETSTRLPYTGTSDVMGGIAYAVRAARDKLRIEAENARRYDRSEGA